MRNKILYILTVLTLLVGCSDSVDFNPDEFYPSLAARYLRVSEQEFNFPSAKANQQSFVVSSIDTPWGFTDVMEWISLSKMSGQQTSEISLSVSENTSGDKERLGIFYVESKAEDWAYNIPLSVYQPAATAYANPELNSITFAGSVSNQTIKVSCNCEWSCKTDVDWLSVVKSGDASSISVTANENLTNASRSASIGIYLSGKRLSIIDVTQKAAGVSLETTSLTFENTAGAYELKLVSEASWTANTSQSWIEVSPTSGRAGESTLRISAIDNTSISERSGYVYINIGGTKVVEIPVKQRGLYIEFEVSTLSFTSEEEEQVVKINSNTSWTISSCPEWMSVAPMSGNGSQDVTIRVVDNPNVSSRKATITASQTGLNLSSKIEINQSGKVFDYGSSTIECSDKAQEVKVNVTTTGKWTAKSNNSWITVTPTSMTGNSELILSIEENGEDDTRTGTITLTIGDKSYTLSIIQAGKYFKINYGETAFESTGATLSIEVSTNDSWIAQLENNASWITLSQTSGFGNASFTATIADNPSVNKRSAIIVLTTAHNKSVRIPINQAARYMNVDHQSVTFFAVGGTSEDITISTDGKYSITCSATWFNATEKGNGVFNVTAEENTTKEVREGAITIKMTDLKEGTYSISMPVLQSADGANFIIVGYGDDKNWDIGASASVSITVTGYGTDKNWDSAPQSTGLTVTITGFSEDKNWDSKVSTAGDVSYQGYSGDNNWNN